MAVDAILFYVVAAVALLFALGVVFSSNPVFSVLNLVLTMVSLSFMFILLKSPFIATIQLAVYAGAVMVLFVMVVMLFDLKKEVEVFSKGRFSTVLKVAATGWIAGIVVKTILMSSEMLTTSPAYTGGNAAPDTKELAKLLFTKYLFAFEALGLLLLLIAVGAVAISRIRGGTHAKS